MPEGVGDITNFLNMSKIAGNSMTEKQIANKRFPADQEFIWKNIPGSNANTTITNELLKDFAFLGPDLKVILQYNNAASYALAVGLLADRMAGAAPLVASWPRQERSLSRSERTRLQSELMALGFDAGAAVPR